jgi:hypothetical protein
LLPVPRDQEQPIVDRDAETEQGGDRRRGSGERENREPTLKIAETSGIAAATSDPNISSRRSRAQPRPMSSDVVSLVF